MTESKERAADAQPRKQDQGAAPAPGVEREVPGGRPPVADATVADVQRHRALAMQLEQRGNLEGALAELTRALDVQADDVSLLCTRATLLTTMKRFDRAEADLRRATRLDPDSADVQLSLGILFCKRARWREAVPPLQRAVELAPTRVLAHYHLAEAYNQTDQLRDALTAYETVVRLEPENWRALKGVGIVLDRLGRPVEATAAYQRAREVQQR